VNSRSRSLYVVDSSSVCRLSVTFVRPTQATEIFDNVSTPFGMLAICRHPGKILRRSSQGYPSVGRIKHKTDRRIYRFWTYRTLYLGNGAR